MPRRLPSTPWLLLLLAMPAALGAAYFVASNSAWWAALWAVLHTGPVAALRAHQAWLNAQVAELGWRAPMLYVAVYITLTGLTLPLNAPMALAAGAMFGLWEGVALTALSTSIGACISCFTARTLLRDWAHRRLHGRLAEFETGFAREGALYLLALRLIPLVPYTVINLLFGLTRLPLRMMFFCTLIGTLPSVIAFVNAGTELQNLESSASVLGGRLLVSLTLLGSLPVAANWARQAILRRKMRTAAPSSAIG